MDRCGSVPLLSTPHALLSIWTDLKRSEKIPGTPAWKWEEWIWPTGPSGLHRNSPQGLNICTIRVFDQIRDPKIPFTLRAHNKYINKIKTIRSSFHYFHFCRVRTMWLKKYDSHCNLCIYLLLREAGCSSKENSSCSCLHSWGRMSMEMNVGKT